jgi:hypothetical protein
MFVRFGRIGSWWWRNTKDVGGIVEQPFAGDFCCDGQGAQLVE